MIYKINFQLKRVLFTFLFLTLFSISFAQNSVTIFPSADADIFAGATTANYGSCEEIWVGGSPICRSLLNFELTTVPPGATIISAFLEMDVTNSNGTNVQINVHQITNNWVEGSGTCVGTTNMPVSWTRRMGTTNWGSSGGDFSSTVTATASVGDEGTYSWDVTTLVTNWSTGTANYGVLFKFATESGLNVKYFATKENADPDLQPRLIVTYSLPTTSPVWYPADQKESSGSGNILTVNRPDNLLEGDLIILIFTQQNSPNTTASGFSTPTGFTLIRSQKNTSNVSRPEVVAFYKIASDNEPAQYTSTVGTYNSTSPNWKALAGRVTGHDPSNPVFTTSNGVATNSTAVSAIIPTFTLTYANSLLIAARTVRILTSNEISPPGMTLLSSQNGTGASDNTTNAPALSVTSEARATSGATGTRTFNWTGTAYSAGLMFSINPQIGLPGGIATPNLWVKANSGVLPNTDGASLTTWRNFNNTSNATQTTAAYQPIYRKTSNLLNFNPAVEFDGSNDCVNAATNHGVTGTSPFTDFVVAKRFSQNSDDDLWGQANTSSNSGAHSMSINNPYQNINYVTNSKTGTTSIPINLPFLVGVNRSGSNLFQLYHNGITDGSLGGITNFGGSFRTNKLCIGARAFNSRPFHGQIGEVIIFSRSLPLVEINRINSYLALKYGISMNNGIGAQYIASDGTTIFWNNSINSGFNYGIFGIGRDDISTLQQQISRSSNSSDVITLSSDDDFTSPNTYHNIINTDLSFVMIGNNNSPVSAESSEIDYSIYNSRISREWKVQNTDFTDSVSLKFDGFGSTDLSQVYLIKKNNNSNFSSGTTEVGALNANGEIIGITLNNNDYFTLAFKSTAPGGVFSDLRFWVKADAGVITVSSTVSQWRDQSGNNRHISQPTVGNRPTLSPIGQNFNPTIHFNAANTQFFSKNTNFNIFAGSYSIYIVGYNSSGQRTFITVNETGGVSNNSGIHIEANDPSSMRFLHRNPADIIGGDNLIQTANFSNSRSNVMSFFRNTITKHKFVINGEIPYELTPLASAAFVSGMFTDMTVGQLGSENTRYLDGDIAEIIIYNNDNEINKNRIESYLALKYGVSLNDGLGSNYTASNGNLFWDAVQNNGYHNDIFGIGRDDVSTLHQKQSISVNNDPFFSVYYILLDAELLPASNLLNAATLPNNMAFLMFGNDNGDITFWSRFLDKPPFIVSRIERIWKVQRTGSLPSTQIVVKDSDFPSNTGILPRYLLVSASPNMQDATYYPMTKSTIDNTWRVFFNFSTPDANFISFGYGFSPNPMRHGKAVIDGELIPYK